MRIALFNVAIVVCTIANATFLRASENVSQPFDPRLESASVLIPIEQLPLTRGPVHVQSRTNPRPHPYGGKVTGPSNDGTAHAKASNENLDQQPNLGTDVAYDAVATTGLDQPLPSDPVPAPAPPLPVSAWGFGTMFGRHPMHRLRKFFPFLDPTQFKPDAPDIPEDGADLSIPNQQANTPSADGSVSMPRIPQESFIRNDSMFSVPRAFRRQKRENRMLRRMLAGIAMAPYLGQRTPAINPTRFSPDYGLPPGMGPPLGMSTGNPGQPPGLPTVGGPVQPIVPGMPMPIQPGTPFIGQTPVIAQPNAPPFVIPGSPTAPIPGQPFSPYAPPVNMLPPGFNPNAFPGMLPGQSPVLPPPLAPTMPMGPGMMSIPVINGMPSIPMVPGSIPVQQAPKVYSPNNAEETEPEETKKKQHTPPHILFFLADDAGWNNVGFHNSMVHTPAIDDLRRAGIELTRHYAYKKCSPSRSAFLSGRLPVHVNEYNKPSAAPYAGVHPNFTIFPELLKKVGYRTHHVGKWHVGFASKSLNLPTSRGFDTSLSFLQGSQDHYTQLGKGDIECGQEFTDLWLDDGPALGLNGTEYSLHIFRDRALDILKKHDPKIPLFLYMSFSNPHEPLQVPSKYLKTYSVEHAENWRLFQGMMTAMDETISDILHSIHAKHMWDNSLVVWTSDNGGLISRGAHTQGAANNYPFRGGKHSDWEGGFRVPAVVSGGIIPIKRQNAEYNGITHIADWYTTFCGLAGVSAEDTKATHAALPDVDGKDLRRALFEGVQSPWAGKPMLLASTSAPVMIIDDYKVIQGHPTCSDWSGPNYPNLTHPSGICGLGTKEAKVMGCGDGCIFNVVEDPGEHEDLRMRLGVKQDLLGLIEEELKHVYYPNRGEPGLAPCDSARKNGGYWGPYLP